MEIEQGNPSAHLLAKFFVFGRAEVEEGGESLLGLHSSILNRT